MTETSPRVRMETPAEVQEVGERRGLGPVARGRQLAQSRTVVGLTLVAAGIVWAIARGLHFYGFSPVHLAYDLDQPPWLLVLVSAWLWFRSRRR